MAWLSKLSDDPKMRLISGKLNPFQFIVDSQGGVRRADFWDGVIPLILDLKQQLGSRLLRVVVDAYFCKVPFLVPLKKYTPQKLSVAIYGKQVQVEAVEREVFIRGFQPQVKVVIAKGNKEPIIFLSTDLTLSAVQIIEIYAARFSIELAIRDLKQHFGLAHYQCYLGIAIDRFVHLACDAIYVYKKSADGKWLCAIDNSYGVELLKTNA